MKLSLAILASTFLLAPAFAAEPEFSLTLRSRIEKDGKFETVTKAQPWAAKKTAVIVCDMWDPHHCLNAVRREEEMAPRMDEFLKTAREQGRCHHPRPAAVAWSRTRTTRPASGRQDAADGQEPAQGHRPVVQQDPGRGEGQVYPIDQTDGGEDDDPAEHAEWHAKLDGDGPQPQGPVEVRRSPCSRSTTQDAISDSGVEIWNLLEAARHRQRHPARRPHQHVRPRPAVRPAADGQERQERRPGARPDRHDVQPEDAAATSATSRAPT